MLNRIDQFNARGTMPRGLLSLAGEDDPIHAFRQLAPLPFFAQQEIDGQVLQVGLERLTIVRDFLSAGLIKSIPDWLGVMSLYWESVGKQGGARRTMIPNARGENSRADRIGTRLPIFCTVDDFELNARELMASQRANQPLDVSEAAASTRRVNEAVEDQAINGWGINVSGNSAPGLLNAPGANNYIYKGATAWDDPSKVGGDIMSDVKGMMTLLNNAKRYGPYNLYIPTNYGIALIDDYKTYGTTSILGRLQQIQAGGRNLQIEVADLLPVNRTAMVQMTSDVADVVVGQEPTELSWEDNSGWERTSVILACMIFRPKADAAGNSGICLGNV